MDPDLALVIVSDVDGCLVDHETYSHETAADTVEQLERLAVPLVLCSSKTRSELEQLRLALRIVHPFISENGGAIHIPPGYFPCPAPGAVRLDGLDVVRLGRPRDEVVRILRDTAERSGVSIRGFSDMSAEEISRDSGLPLADARLARAREYDEPFRVTDVAPGTRDRLLAALRLAGLRVTRGGRYDHAVGGADKGAATDYLRNLYRQARGAVLFAGLGDAMNDLLMLQVVDVPVIVRGSSAETTDRIWLEVPRALVTEARGPAGWRDAVLGLLRERTRLARLAARIEGRRPARPGPAPATGAGA